MVLDKARKKKRVLGITLNEGEWDWKERKEKKLLLLGLRKKEIGSNKRLPNKSSKKKSNLGCA